jgi:hypothetical protein
MLAPRHKQAHCCSQCDGPVHIVMYRPTTPCHAEAHSASSSTGPLKHAMHSFIQPRYAVAYYTSLTSLHYVPVSLKIAVHFAMHRSVPHTVTMQRSTLPRHARPAQPRYAQAHFSSLFRSILHMVMYSTCRFCFAMHRPTASRHAEALSTSQCTGPLYVIMHTTPINCAHAHSNSS